MEDEVVIVDTEELEDFIHQSLIKKGFVPSNLEVEELGDIFFDYLVHIGIIDESEDD